MSNGSIGLCHLCCVIVSDPTRPPSIEMVVEEMEYLMQLMPTSELDSIYVALYETQQSAYMYNEIMIVQAVRI